MAGVHDEAMMCCFVTALVTLPGALLSIQVIANVGCYRGIGARTLECPSICFTHLRDMLKTPLEPEKKMRMKCVIAEGEKKN